MTDDARRAALDYLAALTDDEAAAFTAEARNAEAATRDFARRLFGSNDDNDDRGRGLFAVRTTTD